MVTYLPSLAVRRRPSGQFIQRDVQRVGQLHRGVKEGRAPPGFPFRVCTVYNGHVVVVNDKFFIGQGSYDKLQDSLARCQQDWEYLRDAGAEGWELVAATPPVEADFEGMRVQQEHLYLKREQTG
jgi:hypothetical protein